MVRIGGWSTKFVLSDRWIVYTKSRKQLLHRKYLLYETGCISYHFAQNKNLFNDPPIEIFIISKKKWYNNTDSRGRVGKRRQQLVI